MRHWNIHLARTRLLCGPPGTHVAWNTHARVYLPSARANIGVYHTLPHASTGVWEICYAMCVEWVS